VTLARQEPVGTWTLPYLNRLSDLLFVLARAANRLSGDPDRLWNSRA
jgi:cob(I)alamin adenosyltransferase